MILHAPLALLGALFIVTIAVAAPGDVLVPNQIGLPDMATADAASLR